MKLNNKYMMVLSGALMLLTSTSLTSCIDDNDWDTNPEFDRLFSPSDLSAAASTTDVELTWKSFSGSSSYIIELSTDSLYGTNEDIREGSVVFGQDGEVTKSPYTLTDLNSDSKYFVRVKACSETQASSNWSYLENISFKTKAENILNSVPTADRGEDFIVLTWEAGMAVTHISYAEVLGTDEAGDANLGDAQTIELTADNIANGTVTLEGLKGSTGYQITILNNGHPRGTRTVTTRMDLPEAEHVIRLAPGQKLTQDSLNKYSHLKSLLVRFSEGAEYDITGEDPSNGDPASLIIPSNMSITFYGAEGDTKAAVKMNKEIIMGGVHSYIRFVNLDIYDAGEAKYFMNQGADASVEELSFTNTTLNDFSNCIIRFKDSKAISVTTLLFENCIIKNQGAGYACFTFDSKTYTINSIVFNNTIFDTLKHGVIALYNSGRGLANVGEIQFNNTTLYNYVGSGKYLIDTGKADTGPAIKISNSIFAKTFAATLKDGVWTSGSKGIRGNVPTVSNSYMTADGIFGSNSFKGCNSYAGTSDDLFTNPSKGDFSIKDNRFETGVGAVIE